MSPAGGDLSLAALRAELKKLADPQRAAHSQRFFKTGPGQYAQGDLFIGIRVPELRKTAKRFFGLSIADLGRLLGSKIHEERFVALIILVNRFEKSADESERGEIYDFYLGNTARINNWDLVDVSAPQIVGGRLFSRGREPLYKLARSEDLWEKRIAVLATFFFIRRGDFSDTLKLCEILLHDKHDLIHKAAGWMLREIANRNRPVCEQFLQAHHKVMPRTMLRYAIEKFPETLRRRFLGK